MFDIRWIRDNPDAFTAGLRRRGGKLDAAALLADLLDIDQRRRAAQTNAQEIQTHRKKAAKEIGALKAKGEDASSLIAEVAKSKDGQAEAERIAGALSGQLAEILSAIPNLPADDVPDGASEDDNVEERRIGEPLTFDFKPKEHFEIGEHLGMMDFEVAARMSGARFVVLSDLLARMERALSAFMLDMHTGTFGYTEINPPALVRDTALFGTGQLPKFGDDLFKIDRSGASGEPSDDEGGNRLWMIPTAEVPLTNLVAGDILNEDTLPRRYTAMTWCFRSEAGSAGKDTRGMIRLHQFSKVEMVSVVTPAMSGLELERMTSCAEAVLRALGLPYRVVSLCTGDIGFSARKTYDIEVWLPGQDCYREISSCSNCGDFQARRMNTRYRPNGQKDTRFVHTLNGSGLAVGRTLVAILENYQQHDGSVIVPEVLQSYMGGIKVINKNGA